MLIGIATGFCSVQDAVQNLLTSSNYLYFICIATYETSIDGSIFLTCTTCIVYQYFKELVAFVLKAGAKVRGFILTAKYFRKFFLFSFSTRFSGSLAKGKE